MTLFKEVLVPANLVPAAAVIREGQALFGITGRKGFVDCITSYLLKSKTLILEKHLILLYLSFFQKSRILCLGVITLNT